MAKIRVAVWVSLFLLCSLTPGIHRIPAGLPRVFSVQVTQASDTPRSVGSVDSPFAHSPEDYRRQMGGGRPTSFPVAPMKVSVEPFLESLEGIPALSARSLRGRVTTIRKGMPFNFGDSFQTGPRGLARVVFELAQVLLLTDTQVQVLDDDAAPLRTDLTYSWPQILNLFQGTAHILIEPVLGVSQASRLTSRFYVKAPGVVMGAIDGNWIVSVTPGEIEIRVLKGSVALSSDLESLRAGKRELIQAGSVVKVSRLSHSAVNIGPAKSFNSALYFKDFLQKSGALKKLEELAAADSHGKKWAENFKKIREIKARVLRSSAANGTDEVTR